MEDTDYKCLCECHEAGVMMIHFMPCCDTCPACEARIVMGRMRWHMRDRHKQEAK